MSVEIKVSGLPGQPRDIRIALAARLQVAAQVVRRQAPSGPRRWRVEFGGVSTYGRTPESAARKVDPEWAGDPRIRLLLGEGHRVGVRDLPGTVEDLFRGTLTPHGRRLVGATPEDFERDLAARGDRRARRRLRRGR